MKFLKKYSSLLLPVGILLAAVVLFAIVFLSKQSLAEAVEQQSVRQASEIESMLDSTPSEKQPQIEKAYLDKFAEEAQIVKNAAVQTTMRQLLSYDIFPKPRSQSSQIFLNYGKSYRSAIESLVNSMGGRDAPTDMEIRNEIGMSSAGTTPAYGGGIDRTQGNNSAMIEAICRRRSDEIAVYANPNIFNWYPFWEKYEYRDEKTAVEDCWYSQLAYWIYEDVVESIKSMNTGSKCVSDSPVKRLLGVGFQQTIGYDAPSQFSGMYGMSMSIVEDRPTYIISSFMMNTSLLGVEPWTGRTCNDEMDVVHFAVSVVVSSRAVIPFIKELCSQKEHAFREGYISDGQEQIFRHNQITVLQSQIESFDRKDKLHEQYYYGDSAVIRLNLLCEYVFVKAGYETIKPPSVIEFLAQKPDAGMTPAATQPSAESGESGGASSESKGSGKSKTKDKMGGLDI